MSQPHTGSNFNLLGAAVVVVAVVVVLVVVVVVAVVVLAVVALAVVVALVGFGVEVAQLKDTDGIRFNTW